MPADGVGYLVFDIEAVADGELVSKLRYPEAGLAPREAVARFREELREHTGRDVVPPTFMLPVAVAVAKIAPDYRLIDVAVLDEPKYRPHVIARGFWQGWRHYGRPPLVTFNGRGYDLPVLEFAAYRYGYALPDWFNVDAKSYEQSRNRYNSSAHIDLMELFSNFGALRMWGGLNLMAHLIGKPGKTGLDGSRIQGLYDDGELQQINDYCRCDALDTYFVFLRSRVLLGKVTLEEEQSIVDEAQAWIESKAEERPAFAHYLEHWGDWKPPAD